MGRAKKVAAEAVTAVTAVADGAAAAAAAAAAAVLPADAGPSGGAESTESINVKSGHLWPRRAAQLPGPVRFGLAVVLSFALSSLGRSLVDRCTQNEVASITREARSRSELFAPAAWRLYVGWLECTDFALLSCLGLRRLDKPPTLSSAKLTLSFPADLR